MVVGTWNEANVKYAFGDVHEPASPDTEPSVGNAIAPVRLPSASNTWTREATSCR